MNIDDYRRIKAEQEAKAKQAESGEPTEGATEEPTPSEEDKVEQPTQEEEKPVDNKSEPKSNETKETDQQSSEETKTPETIHIEGIGEVPIDELKNGYLRQSDYTKKTQELSRQRKEAEEALQLHNRIKSDPQLADNLKKGNVQIPDTADPQSARLIELENRMYDMMLEKDIQIMSTKYPDFEAREVLQTAQEKNLENLEDAYALWKWQTQGKTVDKPSEPKQEQIDLEAEREKIKQEILREMNEKQSTRTTITSSPGAKPPEDSEPKLTPAEDKVRKAQGLSVKEYVTWRDGK